jgi:hypothetical protein
MALIQLKGTQRWLWQTRGCARPEAANEVWPDCNPVALIASFDVNGTLTFGQLFI